MLLVGGQEGHLACINQESPNVLLWWVFADMVKKYKYWAG